MSRPFSYNSENFTTIGNILFCHIKLPFVHPAEIIDKDENIIEIPSAIYDRLEFHSTRMMLAATGDNKKQGDIKVIYTTLDSGKHYLRCPESINTTAYQYLTGYYLLKDI